jgi:hypothetical protein
MGSHLLLLAPFSKLEHISSSDLFVEGDMRLVSQDTVAIEFSWTDKKELLQLSETPANGRYSNLWTQTCFEVFMQPVGLEKYYEFNLSTTKAWNVFVFDKYRHPQPPTEYAQADLLKFDVTANSLKVQLRLAGLDLKKVKVSICAVVVLKDVGTTYWSTKHADVKPNFHHFDSFFIERNAP